MESIIKVYSNQYYDSVQLMYITSTVKKKNGVDTAFVAMGTQANKEIFSDLGMNDAAVINAGPNDMILGVRAIDSKDCAQAIYEIEKFLDGNGTTEQENVVSFSTIEAAIEESKKANLCIISVPGEYAKAEAMKALNAGLHTLIFSDNVPLEEEREIKLFAKERGLLCMGPDCGVTNINGISFLVGSIVRKGPIGICAASGVGLQEVAVLIHEAGSGVSQGIGTGGKDLKDKVGGVTMLSGIDALENDEETKIIVLISRKPESKTLKTVLSRVSKCAKPVIICFMGEKQEEIVGAGAVYAQNLEEAARKALDFVGIEFKKINMEQIQALADQQAAAMSKEQKYVRGLFCGGTFAEEAMVAMQENVGDIFSNVPLRENLRLAKTTASYKNSVIDYGEEEFTTNRPHPVIDMEPRASGIIREAMDAETAVILLDFILGPAVNRDPVGSVIEDIKAAMKMVSDRGGTLAVVASVCGTDADPQKRLVQEQVLREAGVMVCLDNYQASLLAGIIIKRKLERDRA